KTTLAKLRFRTKSRVASSLPWIHAIRGIAVRSIRRWEALLPKSNRDISRRGLPKSFAWHEP
ncbi:hypothetical protein ALC56_03933, partial [Trachymyrmex septentrionalis]